MLKDSILFDPKKQHDNGGISVDVDWYRGTLLEPLKPDREVLCVPVAPCVWVSDWSEGQLGPASPSAFHVCGSCQEALLLS